MFSLNKTEGNDLSFFDFIFNIIKAIFMTIASSVMIFLFIIAPGEWEQGTPTNSEFIEILAYMLLLGVFLWSLWKYLWKYIFAFLHGGYTSVNYFRGISNKNTHYVDLRDARIFFVCFSIIYIITLIVISDTITSPIYYIHQNNQSFYNTYFVPWTLGIIWIVSVYIVIRTIRILFFLNKLNELAVGMQDTREEELIMPINSDSYNSNELMSSLSQVDISNITSVSFLPKSGQGFIIKTPNIKKLAVYITTKRSKTTFETEELRKTFDYVMANVSSDLSKTDFDLVQGKIGEFVKSGGEVKIERI